MISYTDLLSFLRMHYYREGSEITQSGDFLVRGDTISVWMVSELYPHRVHYIGEELEKVEVYKNTRWESTSHFPGLYPNELETQHGKIRPREYVVHPFHGVGIFERLETREPEKGRVECFASLEYAGNDRLLFPLKRQAELMPYIGSRHPRLTRLYSKSWQKTKEKVQRDLIKVARTLLKIYAARQLTTRPPYASAKEWLHILAAEVGFSLTDDQSRSLKEIQEDFAHIHPMDRLICGDVGYGKTEVALRAAAQVMAAGKQVAFLAPTTILSEQHFALMQKRFLNLPVKVEHLSRLTTSQEKAILPRIADGSADLVVGTHRVLGKDVLFRDLGLLIIDEEQKFGVAQKERLKELRPLIDVLCLSATPIPRTLSMSLSGLRGLSILRTAPQGRHPVQTEIASYQDQLIAKALQFELERGGQVYVVHNRVQSLGLVRERICQLLKSSGYEVGDENSPASERQVRVALAHGQMAELPLAKTMSQFLAGNIEVLVASSIVEHGLDSPNANTLIVLHSEWFGLSDLYQLRGRVGRRSVQAYAYFLTGGIERAAYNEAEQWSQISETAKKRLRALKEADTLGSGWSIAMRDLEIRGGGNILGHEQHGSMEAIGLLLYAQLLQEEIGRQAKKAGIQLFQKQEI